MIINLLDISEEGHEFSFRKGEEADIDMAVGEFIEDLKDFSFKVHIFKTGDIFTTQGQFTVQKDDLCSSCGQDINVDIKKKFTEFLMNTSKEDQKGHAPHSGLNLDNQQEVTFVTGNELDMGEFIREQLAVALPPYPRCVDQAACSERQKSNDKYMVEDRPQGHPAFSVLSQLKKKQ